MAHPSAALLLATAIKTAIVLLYVVAGLRLLGKRQSAQLNIYDLVLVMALANSVQNAMTGGHGNLAIGLVAAGTLLLLGRLFTELSVRRPQWEERIIGCPTVIINDGRLVREHMRREHLTEAQVMTALRQHGLTDTHDAKLAVLECDGSLSVVPRDAPTSRTSRRRSLRRR
jgi:uncharacterized membrane protein YcaP (DUF421 family)